ncbi:MAG: recombinase family protein [Pseudomonadota bacterium]
MSETKIREKAVIYSRVSSKGQESDGGGLESQETRCRQYAEAQGLDVAAVFPDTFTGGGDYMERPGMKALLAFLDAQPDERFTVIFDDLKRASRDTRAFLDLRDAFRSRGVRVACLNFKFDDTPEGEFIETIMAAQGALERKQNGRQVAQKMRARMENGYWIHNPPIGYRYETQRGRGKVLVPNPPFDDIVRQAFEGYAVGHFQSQAEIKRFFESHASFPRNRNGEITQQRVTDILGHALYAGFICSENYGIHWLKGQHEPLISLETFEKVRDRRQSVAKAPTRKNIGEDFALRGFVLCGDCGKPYTACWSKGKNKKYPYYLCDTKGCDSYRKSIPRAKIEGEFEDFLNAMEPSRSLMDCVTAMMRTAWAAREAQAKEAISALKRELAAMDKQTDALLARIVDTTNQSVLRAYEVKIADLDKSRALLQEKCAQSLPPKGRMDEFIEHALTFLANPWKIWETGQMPARRLVCKLAFAERPTYTRNQGYRTPKTTLPFKALAGITTESENMVPRRGLEPPRPCGH